jgi:hypothetical protein
MNSPYNIQIVNPIINPISFTEFIIGLNDIDKESLGSTPIFSIQNARVLSQERSDGKTLQ